METEKICQSCSMPLDKELTGTEKDGSKNTTYCKYCYQDGAFVNPDMKIGDMKELVIAKMKEYKIPAEIIGNAVETLPHLKRWVQGASAQSLK